MLKFALLGCGRVAKKHAEIIGGGQLDQGQLFAVCDLIESKASEYGKKYDVPWYTDFHEMMNDIGDNIDVINILSQSGLHAKHAEMVASYRKHIVVEKPMALTLEDADNMIRVCDQAGVKLFVVKQNRYNLPVVKTREALEKGRFGKMVMGSVRVRWCRHQHYYDQDEWRGTWSMDGGVFANQASHHVDLLEWMLGDPISVFAKSRTALVDIETEDTGIAVITFRNGAMGIVEATTAVRPKDLEGSLSLMGDKGSVEIGGFAVNDMKTWNFLESEPDDDKAISEYKQNPPNVYGFGHIEYLKNVVDSILYGNAALVDGLEGRKSLELITAIYESIETGKEVFLRFQPKQCKLGHKNGL